MCSLRETLRVTNETIVDAEATSVDLFLSDDDSLGPGDVFLNRTGVEPISARRFTDVGLGALLLPGRAPPENTSLRSSTPPMSSRNATRLRTSWFEVP